MSPVPERWLLPRGRSKAVGSLLYGLASSRQARAKAKKTGTRVALEADKKGRVQTSHEAGKGGRTGHNRVAGNTNTLVSRCDGARPLSVLPRSPRLARQATLGLPLVTGPECVCQPREAMPWEEDASVGEPRRRPVERHKCHLAGQDGRRLPQPEHAPALGIRRPVPTGGLLRILVIRSRRTIQCLGAGRCQARRRARHPYLSLARRGPLPWDQRR